MTLILETISHGKIDAGYLSSYTGMVRLGEYVFTTKYFCNFVQYLADHPYERKGAVLAYGLDKFQQGFNDDILEFLMMTMESKNLPHELRQSFVNEKIRESQGKISRESEADLQHKLKMLPVKISRDFSSIAVGKYEISAENFVSMACWITNGGWLGWKDEKPEFAELTIKKMKESENHLFMEYQKWLDKK